MHAASPMRYGLVPGASLGLLILLGLLKGGCPPGDAPNGGGTLLNGDSLGNDPLGLAQAAEIEALHPKAGERARRLLGPGDGPENAVHGAAFEHIHAYLMADESGENFAGALVENLAGETLYEVTYRYRGLDLTLGTGDALSLDIGEDDSVRALLTLNGTRPPSRVLVTISADGVVDSDPQQTVVFDTPNPTYGTRKVAPRASKRWVRASSDRAAWARSCTELLGFIRAAGSLGCDVSDLVSGEFVVRIPAAVCFSAKAALATAEASVQVRGGTALTPRAAAQIDASLTTLCKVFEWAGTIGTVGLKGVNPVGVGCWLGTLAIDGVDGYLDERIESAICAWLFRENPWIAGAFEIMGFRNLDGRTHDTPGAVPDLQLLNDVDGISSTEFPFIDMPARRVVTRVILTVVNPDGAETALHYWLASRGPTHFLSLPALYGAYTRGVRGVENVPYPAPPLTILPPCWHYRLRVKTDGPEEAEVLFRVRPIDRPPGGDNCDLIALSGTTYAVVGVSNLSSATGTINEPLSGVAVTVYDRETGNLLASATSDNAGRYALEFPRRGEVYIVAAKAGYAEFGTCHTQHSLSGDALQFNAFHRPANSVCTPDRSRFNIISGAVWPGIGHASLVRFGDVSEGCGESWNPHEGMISSQAAIICVSGDRTRPTFHWDADWVREASGGGAVTSFSVVRVGAGGSPFHITNPNGIAPPLVYGDTSRGTPFLQSSDGSTSLQPGVQYKIFWAPCRWRDFCLS